MGDVNFDNNGNMERSPVFSLDQCIVQAPFRAAPEKAEKLAQKISDLQIRFEDDSGKFTFEVGKGEIRISAGALNLFWAAGYTYWMLYQGYVTAQRAGQNEYRPALDVPAVEAFQLYLWALRNTSTGVLEEWPKTLPRPHPSPPPESLVDVGNELFLVAIAWIILHEIGHVELRQPPVAIAATTKQEEHEADVFATDWMLGEITGPALVLKRSLGIAVANVTLIAIDLQRGSFAGHTHPPSYERAHRNLRFRQLEAEHPVHAFLTALLQVHLTVFGVNHSLDAARAFDALVDDLCFQLSRT